MYNDTIPLNSGYSLEEFLVTRFDFWYASKIQWFKSIFIFSVRKEFPIHVKIFIYFFKRSKLKYNNCTSFLQKFEETAHYKLLKEIFTQIFSTPNLHPKSKPFFDHVFNFSIVDNRIWFRNYQVKSLDSLIFLRISRRNSMVFSYCDGTITI